MSEKLKGKKVAILVADGFEEIELTSPKKALEDNGAITEIVSPNSEKVRAWAKRQWGEEYPVDCELSKAKPENYDALLLPGGVLNPDKLRQHSEAIAFVKAFLDSGKLIAAICHGPQLLIETGELEGRKMTSYPAIRKDLQNAGAFWVDNEVVYSHGIITSRSPRDLNAFNKKIVEELAKEIVVPIR